MNSQLRKDVGQPNKKRKDSPFNAKQDELLRCAITADAILAMGFDLTTGERILSKQDVIPHKIPKDVRPLSVLVYLYARAAHPDDRRKLGGWLGQLTNMRQKSQSLKSFDGELRVRGFTGNALDYRWYRVHYAFVVDGENQHTYCHLSMTDIQEQKLEEQRSWNRICTDIMTGMPNRIAFENEHAQWIKTAQAKYTASTSVLCAVIVSIDHFLKMNHEKDIAASQEIMQQTAKMIQALVHADETCCRYSTNKFALILAAPDVGVLYERIRILKFALDTQNGACKDIPIRIGCNSVLSSSHDPLANLFEKADIALSWANGTDGICDYSAELDTLNCGIPIYNRTMKITKEPPKQGLPAAKENHQVFIRTFGHFDLFVDGKAVFSNHRKSKELLALLVDRRGGFINTSEVITYLWDDDQAVENILVRGRKAAMYLIQTLDECGVGYILETIKGKRRMVTDRFDCDYYRYIDGDIQLNANAIGNYLCEYSWAENTIASMLAVNEPH